MKKKKNLFIIKYNIKTKNLNLKLRRNKKKKKRNIGRFFLTKLKKLCNLNKNLHTD